MVNTMPSNPVLYNLTDDGIAVLTLNNPERRNALSSETLAALENRLTQLANDRDARVVVIRSRGPAFSSGHDLNELVDGDASNTRTSLPPAPALWRLSACCPNR